MNKKKVALITGASTGIGFFLAKEFALNYYDLIIVSQDRKRLENAYEKLSKLTNVHMFVRDLSITENVNNLYNSLKLKNLRVDVLVNNAGFATYGPFVETSLEKELSLIQVNISALIHLTKLIVKDMKKLGSGNILNMSSTASFQPGPNMAVYFASKAFISSFSLALSEELKPFNIYVTTLCPGPTNTSFLIKAPHCGDTRIFEDLLTPQKVAKEGFESVKYNRKIHVIGIKNKILSILPRFAPVTTSTKISKKMLSIKK